MSHCLDAIKSYKDLKAETVFVLMCDTWSFGIFPVISSFLNSCISVPTIGCQKWKTNA